MIHHSNIPTSFAILLLLTHPALVAQETDPLEDYKNALEALDKSRESLDREYRETIERANAIQELNDPYSAEWGMRFLQPGVRAYFDTGEDDEGEVDLFSDGELGISIEFVELFYEKPFSDAGLYWGFSGGAGIASAEGTEDPVVFMLSISAYIGTDFEINSKPVPMGLEVGYMWGVSANESRTGGNRDDGAIFVGVRFGEIIKKSNKT